jgi:dienelactone hydrolase
LNALIAWLRASNAIGATTPLFAIGMSNGGSMAVSLGAVGASAVASFFPELCDERGANRAAKGRRPGEETFHPTEREVRDQRGSQRHPERIVGCAEEEIRTQSVPREYRGLRPRCRDGDVAFDL